MENRRKTYPQGSNRVGSALVDLGRGLLEAGNAVEAEAALAEARRIYRTHPAANEYLSVWADCSHGAALAALGKTAEAEPLLVAAEPRLRTLKTCPPRHYRQALEYLEKLYESTGKPEVAARWRKKLADAPTPK